MNVLPLGWLRRWNDIGVEDVAWGLGLCMRCESLSLEEGRIGEKQGALD